MGRRSDGEIRNEFRLIRKGHGQIWNGSIYGGIKKGWDVGMISLNAARMNSWYIKGWANKWILQIK